MSRSDVVRKRAGGAPFRNAEGNANAEPQAAAEPNAAAKATEPVFYTDMSGNKGGGTPQASPLYMTNEEKEKNRKASMSSSLYAGW